MFFALAFEVVDTYPTFGGYLPGGVAVYKHYIGLASMFSIIGVSLYTVYSGAVFAKENWATLHLNQTQ